jgi:hypothetical protein
MPRRSLGDVIGLIARKICRLTGFVDEIEKDALGDRAGESAGRLCEWQDVKSQRVPTGRQFPRVAPFTERRKQSVHGVKRKPEAVAISASRTDQNRPATSCGLTQIQNPPDLPTYEKRTP